MGTYSYKTDGPVDELECVSGFMLDLRDVLT